MTTPDRRPALIPAPAAVFLTVSALMLAGAVAVAAYTILFAPRSVEMIALSLAAFWLFKPHHQVAILAAMLLPIRDRSTEPPEILTSGLQEAKAKLMLEGRPLPEKIKFIVGFALCGEGPPLFASSNLQDDDHQFVKAHLQDVLLARTSPLERTKLAIKTYSATMRLPDPVISNHLLMEVAARNSAD